MIIIDNISVNNTAKKRGNRGDNEFVNNVLEKYYYSPSLSHITARRQTIFTRCLYVIQVSAYFPRIIVMILVLSQPLTNSKRPGDGVRLGTLASARPIIIIIRVYRYTICSTLERIILYYYYYYNTHNTHRCHRAGIHTWVRRTCTRSHAESRIGIDGNIVTQALTCVELFRISSIDQYWLNERR